MARLPEPIEWLSLVDVSGPFLAGTVLEEAFPQGLETIETPRRQRLRAAYEEWREAIDEEDPQLSDLHDAWLGMVLREGLEYEDEVLLSREKLGTSAKYRSVEHGVDLAPDFAVRTDDGKLRLLINVYPPGIELEKPLPKNHWPASPAERMTLLCRANEVRIGLITNGEQWMLVNAPIGSTSGYASWFARLWWQEPITLKAFQSLLGVRRCFGPQDQTLDALLERSLAFQEEVTDTLGEQVRRAVEVLIQALGRADQDRNGELLKDVAPAQLYEAGLTVMMRLVFILCAEERGLLLLGDPVYDQNYAVSTLRGKLREDADHHGPEVLERRHDAWSRLLSVFRAVYGGVDHEALRLPALGGSIFDPDRFPFLEGRGGGTTWREEAASPLPIDNRTVLLLLTALQVLEQRGGARLLSYRALDVEQIGHVYEGLLEYTVERVPEITLALTGSQKVPHPTITLAEAESLLELGAAKSAKQLAEVTGRSKAALKNAIEREADEAMLVKLIQASGGNEPLARRLLPFAGLIRSDSWGHLLIYQAGMFTIAKGSDRRSTGTHYTPRSLTESIVEKTLQPLVYAGASKGSPHEQWKLKPAAELLELKVCDPAMGSGAFLVQACRYLAERLVEAWAQAEDQSKTITTDGTVVDAIGDAEPMPKSLDERLIFARRLIAERCLYGVDINPLAVELAKLSIWLVTMAKGRPFGFLDHNLRSGDSLLGIHRLDQLTKLTMNPDQPGYQERLFGHNIGKAVDEAMAIRSKLRGVTIRDIRDVETMARLDSEARKTLEAVELLADTMIGTVLLKSAKPRTIARALDVLAVGAGAFFGGDTDAGKSLTQETDSTLFVADPHDNTPRRKPFHWPLEFPEVFLREYSGFDGIVGNPPYINAVELYGHDLSESLKRFYTAHYKTARGSYDIYVIFWERAVQLASPRSAVGLLVPNKLLSAEYAEPLRSYLMAHCRMHAIMDFSRAQAFAAGVYPISCIVTEPRTEHPCEVVLSNRLSGVDVSQAALRNAPGLLWGYALTDYADLLSRALDDCVPLREIAEVVGAATVGEAYEIAKIVTSNEGVAALSQGHKRFIVSGNIRPFRTTWEDTPVQYIKHRYTRPSVPLLGLPSDTRRRQTETPKIIVSGMSRRPTAFCDEHGDYCAGKSTVLILDPKSGGIATLRRVTQVLNSRMAALIYKALYGGLALAGGYMRFGPPQLAAFPIPKLLLSNPNMTCDSDKSVAALYGVDVMPVTEAFARTFEEDASHGLNQSEMMDMEND